MSVTLTSLEALIFKATHEALPYPDPAALEAFCAILKESPEGPQLAAQVLAARINSLKSREVFLALSMLDRCMKLTNAAFRAEVGKFRFLNEMIKLVSPKYYAARTSQEVQNKVVQLLYAWSVGYPNESKFKVAYDMLRNQGVIKENPPTLPPEDSPPQPKPRPKNAVFDDEEKSKVLQKLLQSKKPEDIREANRLIKTMVREDERHSEALSQHAQDTARTALDSIGLLSEMLEYATDATPDDEQLIQELHANCVKLKPMMKMLTESDVEKCEELTGLSAEVLNASRDLETVFAKYEDFMLSKVEKANRLKDDSSALLDFAGPAVSNSVQTSMLDDLGDIFSSKTDVSPVIDLLQPVNLAPINGENGMEQKNTMKAWNELESIGEQLLKDSLPENAIRLDGFTSKTKKTPMNALEKRDRTPPKNMMLDLNFFTQTTAPQKHDDVMINIVDNTSILDLKIQENVSPEISHEAKPLTDLHVTLDSIKPSSLQPLTVFRDDAITVVLHFCKDTPRPDVNVMVVSTTSVCNSLIEDYKFQALFPKGCKVKLMPPSATSLPAFNPFLPPPALTQVMLLARTSPPPAADMKYIITYVRDEETCSEIGEIPSLPLDDIK